MLSKSHRFHGYGSVRRVYARGQRVRVGLLSLSFAPRRAGQGYRVAIVVSRKVHKSAVQRNRIRRRLYEVVRQLPAVPTADLVITVLNDRVAGAPATELQKQVEDLLQKAADRLKTVA